MTIDGAGALSDYSDGELAGTPSHSVLVEIHRISFNLPPGVRPVIRGDWNDAPYSTFAIARPGDTQAGPLAVIFSDDSDGNAHVRFTGEWQFPAQVVAIVKNGLRARKGVSARMNGALGSMFDISFDCKASEIKEVHFRLRGLHRFVITGIAPELGVPTTPMIFEEEVAPVLDGKGPVWTGDLPEEEPWRRR